MERLTAKIAETLGLADFFALAFFLAAVHGLTLLIERKKAARPSLSRLMADRRARWMSEMAKREMRMTDAQFLGIQHRGAGFFASASMIAVGGCVALLGATDQILAVAQDFSRDLTEAAAQERRAAWELKIIFTLCVLVLAMLKFVWAHRLFGYCAVLMGATPPASEPGCETAAAEAAAINTNAGRSFNRGLRLVYFAFAALAWVFGALALALATLLVVAMLMRREYASHTRRVLGGSDDAMPGG